MPMPMINNTNEFYNRLISLINSTLISATVSLLISHINICQYMYLYIL